MDKFIIINNSSIIKNPDFKMNISCKYHCDTCNFNTNFSKIYITHLNTSKHKRCGNVKTHLCAICLHIFNSVWNYKIHYLTKHTTDEEKENVKYNCKECKKVFFCEKTYLVHINGQKHKYTYEAQKRYENEKIKFFLGEDIMNLNNQLLNDYTYLNSLKHINL